MARRTEAAGGRSRNVTSVCHWLALPPWAALMSSTWAWSRTLGMVGWAVGERAHAARERHLGLVVEVLVPEEEDLVLDQRRPDGLDGGIVERRGQVDPGDLGADVAGDG